MNIKIFSTNKSLLLKVSLIFFATIAYQLDIDYIYTITLLAILYISIPRIGVIKSKLSILITSLLVYFSLIQLSAAIQFMLFRNGGFEAIVITNAILIIICIVLFEKKNNEKIPIFNQQDMISFMIFAMFLLPFAYIAVKKGTYEAITNIGGIQVVDSTVHYDSLGYEETRGGYQYNKSYYPRGFHVSTSLVQSDLGVVQRDSSWKTNALIYALQYLIFAALLVYSTIYLATTLLKYFYQNSNKKSSTYEYFTLGITLAIPLLLLYLFLFVQQGFLNYFYVSAAILFASTFLFLEKRKTIGELLISNSFIDKIPLVFFILITIGVSYSWPIFTPVLLLIILLSLLSVDKFSIRKIAHILNSKNILIFILILFHLVAIYFQIHYDAKNGLEATGALSSFNSFFFTIFFIGILFLYLDNNIKLKQRMNVLNVVIPYVLLIAFLMLVQYYLVGESRYYLIKSSIIMELILFAILVPYFIYRANIQNKNHMLIVYLPVLMSFLTLTSIGYTKTPLLEIRSLYRDYNSISKPNYYDEDISKIIPLAVNEKLHDYNLIVLHADNNGNLYSHAQISRWVNAMGVADSSNPSCFYNAFNELAYTSNSVDKDNKMIKYIKECSNQQMHKNNDYYIITDSNSVNILQNKIDKIDNIKYIF